MIGGARQFLVHKPEDCMMNDEDDKEIDGVAEFLKSWPTSDVTNWPELEPAELSNKVDQSGCWTGSKSMPF
jgi:hypothetical protein